MTVPSVLYSWMLKQQASLKQQQYFISNDKRKLNVI